MLCCSCTCHQSAKNNHVHAQTDMFLCCNLCISLANELTHVQKFVENLVKLVSLRAEDVSVMDVVDFADLVILA